MSGGKGTRLAELIDQARAAMEASDAEYAERQYWKVDLSTNLSNLDHWNALAHTLARAVIEAAARPTPDESSCETCGGDGRAWGVTPGAPGGKP